MKGPQCWGQRGRAVTPHRLPTQSYPRPIPRHTTAVLCTTREVAGAESGGPLPYEALSHLGFLPVTWLLAPQHVLSDWAFPPVTSNQRPSVTYAGVLAGDPENYSAAGDSPDHPGTTNTSWGTSSHCGGFGGAPASGTSCLSPAAFAFAMRSETL